MRSFRLVKIEVSREAFYFLSIETILFIDVKRKLPRRVRPQCRCTWCGTRPGPGHGIGNAHGVPKVVVRNASVSRQAATRAAAVPAGVPPKAKRPPRR